MSIQMFLSLLFAFSVISSLLTEAIKKVVADKKNLAYNIVALIIALVVGCGGTVIYYVLKDMPIGLKDVIYICLMGIASGLTAELGYDKVVQAIKQITTKEEK